MERRCARCKAVKHEDDFAGPYASKPRKDTLCRPCRAAYQHDHYLENRPVLIARSRARNEAERHRRVALIVEYLRFHPCVDCGETDPVVLEFDHLGEKSFTVAAGLKTRSWAAIQAEIEKCEVVCVNCHRRRTATRGGFRRLVLAEARFGQGRLFGSWIDQ